MTERRKIGRKSRVIWSINFLTVLHSDDVLVLKTSGTDIPGREDVDRSLASACTTEEADADERPAHDTIKRLVQNTNTGRRNEVLISGRDQFDKFMCI